MTSPRDREPACGFCDGTGLWEDPDTDPTFPDPCPLCDGSGLGPHLASPVARVVTAPSPPVVAGDVVALLAGLTQPERQQVYELLHARYDCRIYRS